MRWRQAIVIGVVCWSAAYAAPTSAHPLGNFTINHLAKLRANPRGVSVRYVVDMAEIPTFQVLAERNVALDGEARVAGLAAWGRDEAALVKSGLSIVADGVRVSLIPGTPRVTTRRGAGGLPTLYFVDDMTAPYPGRSIPHTIRIADDNYAGRIGWKDIVIGSQTEPTHELRSYPNALLGSPRSITRVGVTLGRDAKLLAVTQLNASMASVGTVSQVRSNLLSDLLARGSRSAAIVLLTLLAAVGLGALHALEPGHGKTLLAVSLVGARATPRQAMVLASALTLAHTLGVIALGLALLVFARFIVPEMVYPWVALGSGACVAVLGARALSGFVKRSRGESHQHPHGSEQDHASSGHGHTHQLPVSADAAPLSFHGVVLLAMSGNIAPCPAALVVLLSALSLHRLGYGILVVVAFSIGLALVLTALGISVVRGAAWLGKQRRLDRLVRFGPLATAIIISTIGVVMLAQATSNMLQVPGAWVAMLTGLAIAGYALAPGHAHHHRAACTAEGDAT